MKVTKQLVLGVCYGAVFGFEFIDDVEDELKWVLHLGPIRIMRFHLYEDTDTKD